MGVNIHINCESFDPYANGGMKEILYNREAFPRVYFSSGDYEMNDDFRPTDFVLWRKSIVKLNCNVDMWLKALDFLEANPDEKISYSN